MCSGGRDTKTCHLPSPHPAWTPDGVFLQCPGPVLGFRHIDRIESPALLTEKCQLSFSFRHSARH